MSIEMALRAKEGPPLAREMTHEMAGGPWTTGRIDTLRSVKNFDN
jgi:hypothetical protein